MPRRTDPTPRTQGRGAVDQLLLPLVEGALATKALLHETVLRAGLAAVLALFAEDAVTLAGPKGRRRAGRTANHWGTAPAELVMGGRKVILPRPRVRTVGGSELTLPSVARFASRDPLTARVVNQILVGVSTRRYERSLEPLPAPVRAKGTSRSAVSRTFVGATRQKVEEELGRSLAGLDLAALMLDAIVVKRQSVVVALGVAVDGSKHVLGLRLGSTENAMLCGELLQDLLRRGLKVGRALLCVIDGGGGLRRALRDVFGDLVLIQRCQVHKMRNLRDHLPKKAHAWVLSQITVGPDARIPAGVTPDELRDFLGSATRHPLAGEQVSSPTRPCSQTTPPHGVSHPASEQPDTALLTNDTAARRVAPRK